MRRPRYDDWPLMFPDGPTQAEADALVGQRKYIKAIPVARHNAREEQMLAQVFSVATRQPNGLLMIATAKKSPTGVPTPPRSAALAMNGRFRIRGINYSVWHDCPSGPIVYGWHEHVWTNQYQDRVVVPARPKPDDTTMRGLFQWGLEKWNIAIGEPSPPGNKRGKNKKTRGR